MNYLDGDAGNDTLTATAEASGENARAVNELTGGDGNDVLFATVTIGEGAVGYSELFGDAGDDRLRRQW